MMSRTEPGGLYATMRALAEAGRPFAVATVLAADHSTPVKAGAKAVIEANGMIHGTVGGGAVEAEAKRQGKRVARSGVPVVFDFDLRGRSADESHPICGGSMRLLVAPASSASGTDYRRAADALARRQRGLWVTTLHQRNGLAVQARFVLEKQVAAKLRFPTITRLRSCLAQDRAELFAHSQPPTDPCVEVFVEPVIPPPVLIIVGGGHVGQAVAAQARLLGFRLVVIEDRPPFADRKLFPPGTQICCGPVAEQCAKFPLRKDTFVVLVTRGHPQDSAALRVCIRQPAAYIGMIGSRRKVPLMRRQFLENRWATAAQFKRVHAPIGLDIGAATVPEIAASILAQIIAVRRKGAALRMPRR